MASTVAQACAVSEDACTLVRAGASQQSGWAFANPYEQPMEVAQQGDEGKPTAKPLPLEQVAEARPMPAAAKLAKPSVADQLEAAGWVPAGAEAASSDGRPVGKEWEALSDREKAQWYAKDAAYEHGVPFPLMHSLFWHESGFNPKAYNNCDAAGVGQMIEGTARGMGLKTSVIKLKKPMRCGKYLIWHKATPADERFDPKKNIYASVKYFAGLRKHYGNDKLALVHYNGGRRAVNAWLKANGYRESKHYVSSIMSNAQRMGYGG